MKNARNTSRQFWAIHHYRPTIASDEENWRDHRVDDEHALQRKQVCRAVKRYGAALWNAGVRYGDVFQAVAPIRRLITGRCDSIRNYMTRREAARYMKRIEWASRRGFHNHLHKVRLWEKYGRVCPYKEERND